MALSRFGDFSSFAKFLSFSTLGGITTYYLMNPREKKIVNERNVIVATGCDSGLGFSIAVHCHKNLNMSVVAMVHQMKSRGAKKLKDMFAESKRFHVVELEVTSDESVQNAKKFVQDLLEKNEDLKLTALVNNAGVMCFGETEWQTQEIIDSQISVNLAGSIRVTKAFLPLVRQHKSRIINVTSHCALQSLPLLPIYCATKAGLKAFNDSLRLDMAKYGVEVVNLIPGSFFAASNISAAQNIYHEKMLGGLDEEQIGFYGEYMDRFKNYLGALAGEKDPQMVDDSIIQNFEEALLQTPPKHCYISEPPRYTFYHLLFKVTPQRVTDWLVHKFVAMPQYDPSKSITKS